MARSDVATESMRGLMPDRAAAPRKRPDSTKRIVAGSKATPTPSAFFITTVQKEPGLASVPGLGEMLRAIEAGLSPDAVAAFVSASGIELKDVYEIVIPARTLKHRRSRKEPLSRDESDKLARLMRVFNQTVTVFGDRQKARNWLYKAKKRFDDQTPLRMLRTELGARMVEEMLGQIDGGMFA